MANQLPPDRPNEAIPEEAQPPLDSDAELTREELEALSNDPDANWRSAEEVMARLREIDACTP